MFGSTVLDVALGLIFVYLLLSLICSAVFELIEARVKKRASDLERGIRGLLSDPDGKGLAQKLYKHPLVFSLFQGNYNPTSPKNLPSYIPARNFALALMDVVLPAKAGAEGVPATPSGAAGATAATPAQVAGGPSPLATLRAAIDEIPSIGARQALRTLVDAAGDDVGRARENIEGWYNSAMDRVSGWYKRRAQVVILGIGFVTAALLNVDSVSLGISLSRDKEARTALAAAAVDYGRQQQQPQQQAAGQRQQQQSADERLKADLRAVDGLGLPIGWNRANDLSVPPAARVDQWLLKLAGWAITAAAVSLGAPFWFDLLNKFMVIRSTVKPHEKSPEEKSND